MKISTVLKVASLAFALAAGAASPVSAHGAISFETFYYENGQQVGHVIRYCDGHDYTWGNTGTLDYEMFSYPCD